MIKSLNDLSPGTSGTVCEIRGGQGLINRLNAMGIITGKKIKKIDSMLMSGPVTVQVDRAKVAIGFGMAGKIFIEAD